MASLGDELAYLSPSFDPTALTMPRLRNILMSHDIAYPASAKKPQLIDIFTNELKPKARKILAARDRVRRTSRGITDMPGSHQETVNGGVDSDTGSMPPPPLPDTPRQRKSRMSTHQSIEPTSEPSTNSMLSNSRRSSSKHSRPSDTEPDSEPTRPAIRKSRKSEASATVKNESPKDKPVRAMRGGVFSDENPFQSGSSPLISGETKRKSGGTINHRRKSSSSSRTTVGVQSSPKQQDGIVVPTSKSFVVPVSNLKQSASEDSVKDEIAAGEEFTPEEQLELARERAANGEMDIPPPSKKKRVQKPHSVPKSAPWIVLLALSGGYATWWRQEKVAVGYCGIARLSNILPNVQLPKWAELLQPTCEPCPQHAICFQGLETRCEHDFILQPHPLSLGGLLPLPPRCEPDGEKVRRVKAVVDKAVEELRERKAQAECGTLKDSKGKHVPAKIDEDELKREVGKKRRRNMDAAEFDDLWKGAIGEIIGREDVVSSSNGTHLHLSSTSLANLPFSCAVKRSARLTLARYRLSLSLLTFCGITLFYIRSLIMTSRRDTARIPLLVATTLDRLATQAALHARGGAAESWISVGQLRDDVLRDEFSDRRRESLWKRVRAVVERNANVRASVREGRVGDVSRMWEWIGSVGFFEDVAQNDGTRKRVSFGPGVEGSSVEEEGQEMTEKRKWDESRPVY